MPDAVRLRYASEAGRGVDDPSEGDLDDLLSRLDGVDDSYASLTFLDGSGYVQVGGGPDEFTVEVREARPDGTFRHLKAAGGGDDPTERRLSIGGADVAVRADQVLDFRAVSVIFRAFLHGGLAAGSVLWHDITPMFVDVA